jgi:tryptophan 2,3-dioxygenase
MMDTVQSLEAWRETMPLQAEYFPDEGVLPVFHAHGKHFVPVALLDELVAALKETSRDAQPMLSLFLHALCDKRQGVYDYHTYIASALLEAGCMASRGTDLQCATALLCDALHFECGTCLGIEHRLPHLTLPQPQLLQRSSLLAQAIDAVSALMCQKREPLFLEEGHSSLQPDTCGSWLQWTQEFKNALPTTLRQAINWSMLPVFTSHDEYMFIRILQASERLFALIAHQLHAATDCVEDDQWDDAVHCLQHARRVWAVSPRLFKALNTMTPENFASFRIYTEGASAIQSNTYPAIVSAAHKLNETVRSKPTAPADLLTEMDNLDKQFLQWKQIHHGIARKKIGDEPGTGSTPGTPYLRQQFSTHLFTLCSPSEQ